MVPGKMTVCAHAVVLGVVGLGGAIARGQSGDVPFTRMTVDDHPPSRPYYKMVGDLNGDSLLDIVVGGARGPLVWYAYPDWRKTRIAQGGWDGVDGEIADIDRDGDVDIVMGGIVWFANPGVGGGEWKATRIDRQKAHDIELADIDLDGRLDVVARDQSAFGGGGNTIYIYHQENPTSWTRRTIDCPHGEGLKLEDLDRDGDADIVIGRRWYENPRRPAAAWTAREYTTAWKEPDTQIETADLNRDGRPDIVLTPAELKGQTHKIAWYESPDDPTQGDWIEHVIVPSIECVIHSLGLGDFDRDGDVDVAIAEMHQGADPDEVSVHLNQGGGTAWRKQIISTDGSHDIVVADIGGDGDLDIVGANHAGDRHPLELWTNGARR